MFSIATPQLILRDMAHEDESAFVAISQDKKFQRFYSEEDCTVSKYQELTRLFIQQANETPRTAYQLAVELKQTGQFLGTACLRLESDNQASIGCGLSRSYQGKGLIHEAITALVDFGFNHLNLHRIYAETISENKAAIRLCEGIDMRKEALLRENRYFKGRWWDTAVLAILRAEWEQKPLAKIKIS